MMRWYAAYTQPGLERWARTNLWHRGLEVYLPEYRRRRSHARKVDWVAAPLFPRYLFVRADLAHAARRVIRTAAGVVDLVAFGPEPAVVGDAVIAELRAREDGTGMIDLAERPLSAGDSVRIAGGPLHDLAALFEGGSDTQRVVVLLRLLGREVRVRLAPHQLERNG